MAHCKKCGKFKFLLSSDGLCLSCAMQDHNEEKAKEAVKNKRNRTYHVVGLNHYGDGIKKAFTINEDFSLYKKKMLEKYPVGSKIMKYNPKIKYPAELVPDPENPYDKNAIRVMVNDNQIGHIDRDTAAKFDAPLNLITECFAKVVESPHKEIIQDQDGNIKIETYGVLDITVTISFH